MRSSRAFRVGAHAVAPLGAAGFGAHAVQLPAAPQLPQQATQYVCPRRPRLHNLGAALPALPGRCSYDSSLPDKNYTQQAGRWDQGMELVCNRDYRECQDWPQWAVWEVPAYRLPGEDKRTDPAPSLELNLTVYQARSPGTGATLRRGRLCMQAGELL